MANFVCYCRYGGTWNRKVLFCWFSRYGYNAVRRSNHFYFSPVKKVAHATTATAKKFICPRKCEQTWQKRSKATVEDFKMFTVLCLMKGRERQKEWSRTFPIMANHLGASTQGQVFWMSLAQLCQSFCNQTGFWSSEWLNIANFKNFSALHFAYDLILFCPK